MLTWLLLAAAIAAEVCATVSLKLSEGFTRLGPSAVVVAGYLASFVLLSQILSRGMNLGVVYAVWSALGIAVIVLIDRFFFHERLSGVQVAGLVFVVIGVAALQLGEHDLVTDAPPDGRLLRGERARRALVAATLTIIERDGLCRVTHRNVTREAGLPPSSAAYHFSSISDLLEQALLWADQQAADSLERVGRAPDPVAAFAAWLVEDLVEQRPRVIAEYELFLYAARLPSMRPTAVRWLTDLERLVSTWTADDRAVATIRAYVDGMVLQALVSGEQPDVTAVEATLRYLVRGSAPGEARDLAVGARRPAGPVAGAFD